MCGCPGDCEGGPECLDGEGAPLAIVIDMTEVDAKLHDVTAKLAELDSRTVTAADYECGFCQRGQCGRCSDPRCTCCSGNPEDLPRLPGGCALRGTQPPGFDRGGARSPRLLLS